MTVMGNRRVGRWVDSGKHCRRWPCHGDRLGTRVNLACASLTKRQATCIVVDVVAVVTPCPLAYAFVRLSASGL